MLARGEDGIGWMIFNNPARHNALSLEMWQGIGDILQAWSTDDAVRVVVMRGAGGKAFVSGADISEFDAKRASAAQKEEYDAIAGRANRWLANFEKPMIALIEGYCVGGGLATALAADIRFATPDSRFGITRRKTRPRLRLSGARQAGTAGRAVPGPRHPLLGPAHGCGGSQGNRARQLHR